MWITFRTYVLPLAASAGLLTLLGAIASIPGCSATGALLLPGALLAAIVFPQGPESDYGMLYLILAGLLDIILLAFPLAWVWKLIQRKKKARA
jgi:hypothetical protein